jgi:hypothetical protein
VQDSHEHDNISSGCIKGGKFTEKLTHYQLLKKDFALWS